MNSIDPAREAIDERILIPVISLIGLIAWVWFRLSADFRFEEALVTYRCAENMTLGFGLVFNAGVKILCTTSPLFALLLGFAGWFFGPGAIPAVSDVLLFLATLGAGWFTYFGLRRLNWSCIAAGFVFLVLMLHPLVLWTGTGGSEIPLAMFLMAGGFYFIVKEKCIPAGVFAALLLTARADGILWLAGVLLVILLRGWKPFLKTAVAALVILIPWILILTAYYGSPWPRAVAESGIGGGIILGLTGFVDRADLLSAALGASMPFWAAVGWLLFAVGAVGLIVRRQGLMAAWLVLYPLTVAAAFWLGRKSHYAWFALLAAWPALVVGLYGVRTVGAWLKPLAERSASLKSSLKPAVIVLAVVYIAGMIVMDLQAAGFHRQHQDNIDHTWIAAAEWLKRNTPQEASVAAETPGTVGYYAQRKFIDRTGLATPEMERYRASADYYANAFDSLRAIFRPDYLVMRSVEVGENRHFSGNHLFLRPSQRNVFKDTYEEVIRFAGPQAEAWGDMGSVTVFRRKPLSEDG